MLPLAAAGATASASYDAVIERWSEGMQELAGRDRPLIAQVWGPLTMVSTTAGADETFLTLVHDPDATDELLVGGLARTLEHIDVALSAGADIVWISEPMIVPIDPDTVERHALAPLRRACARVSSAGHDPVVHVSGSAAHLVELIVGSGAHGISITAETPLDVTRDAVPDGFVVFGNLTAQELDSLAHDELAARARGMAQVMEGRPYVATPGSALPHHVPAEKLAAFLDEARSHPGLGG
jgi:uroporphyrinogen-III decarboxylase